MKDSNLIIRVPEPCHEDWNKMLPDAKGKFCNSCSKSVFDFSTKTDAEIRGILLEYKDQKVCGHFKKSQIGRPLNITINLNDLPVNISLTKTFAIALFIVFGTFLFSCTNEHGQKVETIEIIKPSDELITLGAVDFMIPPLNLDTSIVFEKGNAIAEIQATEVGCSSGARMGFVTIEPVYDSIVTLDEIPVIANEEPLVDHVVMGAMSYIILDSTRSEENTAIDSSFSTQSKMIDNNITGKPTALTVYPNPSNGEFTIRYDVVKRKDVSLVIYDLNGILVRSLVNVHDQYEGKYQIPVNLKDLPNGIYIVSLIIGDKKSTERIVIER